MIEKLELEKTKRAFKKEKKQEQDLIKYRDYLIYEN